MSMSAATEQIMFNEMMRVRKHGKYSPHESNYTRLFGTPERAARTIQQNMSRLRRLGVQYYDDYDALLEWLEGVDE